MLIMFCVLTSLSRWSGPEKKLQFTLGLMTRDVSTSAPFTYSGDKQGPQCVCVCVYAVGDVFLHITHRFSERF